MYALATTSVQGESENERKKTAASTRGERDTQTNETKKDQRTIQFSKVRRGEGEVSIRRQRHNDDTTAVGGGFDNDHHDGDVDNPTSS